MAFVCAMTQRFACIGLPLMFALLMCLMMLVVCLGMLSQGASLQGELRCDDDITDASETFLKVVNNYLLPIAFFVVGACSTLLLQPPECESCGWSTNLLCALGTVFLSITQFLWCTP